MAVSPAPVRVYSRVSRQSRLSGDDIGDNEMILGLCIDLFFFEKPSMLVWRCHQLPSGFLANDHLPASATLSGTSVDNDKGDKEMILGVVQRSPGICLTDEESPRKPQLGDRLMKELYDQSSLTSK